MLKYLIASGTDNKLCGAFVFETQNSVISFSFKLFLIKLSKPKLATKWSNSLSFSGADGIVLTTSKILSRTSAAGKYPASGIVENFEDGIAIFDDRFATELRNLDIGNTLRTKFEYLQEMGCQTYDPGYRKLLHRDFTSSFDAMKIR